VQIERAKELVPRAKFICADMTEIDFPAQTFAAVVSFYAIIHVPLAEQRSLFTKLYHWLKPEGYLLASVGSKAWTGTEEDWLGVSGAKMYWSRADAATYRHWLRATGFNICWTRFIPEGSGGHELILARKGINILDPPER
jgi:SAM-dependent methyltransferase